ncbi:MAG: hypothetical protein H6707_05560 [Deltaproteobacteria bacterium]|nr:hypothetical protein [Deltaproteobacteria bacterium]
MKNARSWSLIGLLCLAACGSDSNKSTTDGAAADGAIAQGDASLADGSVAADVAIGNDGGVSVDATVNAPDASGADAAGKSNKADVSQLRFSGSCSHIQLKNRDLWVIGPNPGATHDAQITVTATSFPVHQIALRLVGLSGNVAVNSKARTESCSSPPCWDFIINVADPMVWTNLAKDYAALIQGKIPDPITGSISIKKWDYQTGQTEVVFNAVTLQSPIDGGICRVDGLLKTFGKDRY